MWRRFVQLSSTHSKLEQDQDAALDCSQGKRFCDPGFLFQGEECGRRRWMQVK
jgi:hypothetical protein